MTHTCQQADVKIRIFSIFLILIINCIFAYFFRFADSASDLGATVNGRPEKSGASSHAVLPESMDEHDKDKDNTESQASKQGPSPKRSDTSSGDDNAPKISENPTDEIENPQALAINVTASESESELGPIENGGKRKLDSNSVDGNDTKRFANSGMDEEEEEAEAENKLEYSNPMASDLEGETVDEEAFRGDRIGNSTYSERHVLRILMRWIQVRQVMDEI